MTTRQPDSHPENRPDSVNSQQASQFLGITEDAIRKRIARGTLEGYKEDGRWYVRLPDSDQNNGTTDQNRPETDQTAGKDLAITAMEGRIASLETQLATKDQQIDQLHHLLAQAALTQPPESRPWWKVW